MIQSNGKVAVLAEEDGWISQFKSEFSEVIKDAGFDFQWETDPCNIFDARFCFLLGYTKILKENILNSECKFFVVHESALPRGRGWSPLTWQVLEGKASVTVSLIEAAIPVDSGAIIGQTIIELCGAELVDDLRRHQSLATLHLIREFLRKPNEAQQSAKKQEGAVTWYDRRYPTDSKININKTIDEQFNLLRVVDNDRYPAWFDYRGERYVLKIYKESKVKMDE